MTEPLPIPEPPDNSRIEFTHNMRVYAAWSSSEAAVANGYEPEERWRLYDHMAAWVTWSELVDVFGESLRSLVLLKPHFPPQPLELSEVERVAVEHTEHMSTCHEPACVDCMKELRAVRRTIKAVEPVIERRKATDLVDRIAAAVGSYEPEAHPVVCPPSVTYAFAKEKAVEIVRGFAPVEPEAVTQE